MIIIDGAYGEGGGQILRTALALSLVTGQAFRINNIRGQRSRPGLLRQHLTAVQGARQIGAATVFGDTIGSKILEFEPGAIAGGTFNLAVGTAGSATLVLQTILPALLCADCPSHLIMEGGTHNPFAPSYDFLAKVFVPLINQMGPTVTTDLERHGFYPAGGGKFHVKVTPTDRLSPLRLTKRGKLLGVRAEAIVSQLPRHIAERELRTVGKRLTMTDEHLEVKEVASSGPGNVLQIEVRSTNITELFIGFGEKGVSAEKVAEKTITAVQEYLAVEVPVGRYLADQLLLPLALAGGGSFLTLSPSRHTETNIEVIRQFLPVRTTMTQVGEECWLLEIYPVDGE